VDDLDRLGVETLPSGVKSGVHYFHLSLPVEDGVDEARLNRQRRIEAIRETLRKRTFSHVLGSLDPYGAKLGVTNPPVGTRRGASPFVDFGHGGFEHPRALFVRPSEIVYVMGADG
jgi:hypothetical protein